MVTEPTLLTEDQITSLIKGAFLPPHEYRLLPHPASRNSAILSVSCRSTMNFAKELLSAGLLESDC